MCAWRVENIEKAGKKGFTDLTEESRKTRGLT